MSLTCYQCGWLSQKKKLHLEANCVYESTTGRHLSQLPVSCLAHVQNHTKQESYAKQHTDNTQAEQNAEQQQRDAVVDNDSG